MSTHLRISNSAASRRDVLIGAASAIAASAVSSPVFAASPKAGPASPKPAKEAGANTMSFVTTKDGVEIFFKDWGQKSATPIVFHHGWPLSSDDWDAQMLFFLAQGFRAVAHDRRGHGRSSQVAAGHDMDHYASDASAVVEHLDLRNAIHIG